MQKKVVLGSRIILGAIFLIFGGNGLLMILTGSGFIPMPEPKPEMGQVMMGLFGAIYLMPLVKILEVIAGILLLWGRYVTLALTLLAPIIVNILGIHLFLDQSGLPMTMAILLFFVILVKHHWSKFKPLLTK